MSGWSRSETFRKRAALVTWRLRRRHGARARMPGLLLRTLETTVPADLDLLSPTMRVVVIEDLCWTLLREAWLARRPPWWRPVARRAWAAERAALDAKRQRVRDLAAAD